MFEAKLRSMDQGTLIVLTEAESAPSLLSMLTNARPKAKMACAESLEDVQGHCRAKLNGLRLIAFCTDIIVPTSVLELCDAGAYNFYPGSPGYPGLFPSCFAIYEGAISFGATAHRMTQDIDAGEIVGTEIFEIPQDIDRFTLDSKSFEAITRLFSVSPINLLISVHPFLPVEKNGQEEHAEKRISANCAIFPRMSTKLYLIAGIGPWAKGHFMPYLSSILAIAFAWTAT